MFTSGDRGGDPAATLDSENQQDKVLEVVVEKLGQVVGCVEGGKDWNLEGCSLLVSLLQLTTSNESQTNSSILDYPYTQCSRKTTMSNSTS